MLFFYFEEINCLEAPYKELYYNKSLTGGNNYFLYTAKLPLKHSYTRTTPLKNSLLSAKHKWAQKNKLGFSERSLVRSESAGRGTATLKCAI